MERPPKAPRTASPPFTPAIPKTAPPALQLPPPAVPTTPPPASLSITSDEPPPQLRSVIERYYQPFFAVDVGKKDSGEDQYVYRHSNGCALVRPRITNENKSVSLVDYNVTKQSRLQNKVVGKGKKGGIWLEPMSPLCDVTCTDGSKYRFYACIRGHLLEINENLVGKPETLRAKAASDGYLAIINPKFNDLPTITEKLHSPEAYQQLRNITLSSRSTLPPQSQPPAAADTTKQQ